MEWAAAIARPQTTGPNRMRLSEVDRSNICNKFAFGGVDGGANHIRELAATGLTQRELHLEILDPVARQFDKLWFEDQLTFSSVWVASIRIEALLREFSNAEIGTQVSQGKSAVFACVPGDAHSIGINIAANLQRQKGWNITLPAGSGYMELLSLIDSARSGILGLSISSSSSVHSLYAFVRALKSRRPNLKILVAGSLVRTERRSLRFLEVDAYATTFEEAEEVLDQLADQVEAENLYPMSR